MELKDFWSNCLKKEVEVTFKNGTIVSGVLELFDMHANLVLSIDGKSLFVRGDSVQRVSVKVRA